MRSYRAYAPGEAFRQRQPLTVHRGEIFAASRAQRVDLFLANRDARPRAIPTAHAGGLSHGGD
jgi:hypothetical protein